MGSKRYSNKGVNAAIKAQEAAAAEREGKRQTAIICIVAAVVIVVAVAAAIVVSVLPAAGEVDMTAIAAEIDSMEVADFTETDKQTDYVKITVKDHGDIIIRLRDDIAPKTVENFQSLVSEGFYDGLTFHRVISGFMIQGGDPKGDGTGGSDTTIKGEFSANGVKNDLSHIKGVISMARKSTPMDSATSQFFICNADASGSLDGSYAAFGYVVAGLETVDSVSAVEVTTNSTGETSLPVETVTIEKICFVTEK